MKQFEYKALQLGEVYIERDEANVEVLNREGLDGWEVCTLLITGTFILKREIVAAPLERADADLRTCL